ncbi:hypothetical protein EW026_g7335 [Hermanssonia centrifuga]|uniref:Uncharacterized protein n=1 Tax=Hermanssonia centrifuga TaxID=98765 RepID=A0A4S4K9Y9_9APHY|nr:hypothetical protein EW026_g7335 [Hermanssonia centrifuga]
MLKVVNTHTLPKLNLDTFCMISSHIRSTGVMFQFMLTCHGIFNAGVPYLIKLGPFLTSPNAIASFHKFMADDDKRRYKWLKTLKLDLGDSAEATDRLLEIFSNAHTLKRLEIRNCHLLDRDERIRQAIASLTTLKEIKLLRMSVISSAHAMLLEMESDVVNLEVSFFSETGNFIDGEAVIGLQKFAHCAISLHLWVAEFIHCPEEIDTSEYPVYPQVKTLVLDNARVDRLQLLTHAFPNLRSLTVINIDNARGSLEEEEPEGVEEVRDINRVDQEEMAWEALDYCYGNVNNLYTLGMISKIQRLDLSRVVIRDEAEIEQLRAVVTDALPQSLVLHVAAEFEMNALRNALFVALDDLLDFTLIVDIVEAPSSDIDPASVVACIDETIVCPLDCQ